MKKSNIAVFIPHVGCPNKCSFCNQNEITGESTVPGADDVRRAVETSLEKTGVGVCELAFFGGSFTAVDRGYMLSLLEAAAPYVKSGAVTGIRCSTRPDAVDSDTLSKLKQYGVTSIELGAQSMDDGVLFKNLRGHTAADVVNASALIQKFGFALGLQMMTDLYASCEEKDIETAKALIAIKPETARIYPTVILRGTYLEKLYRSGAYQPAGMEERARVAAEIALMFKKNGIHVIRIGLHSGGAVKENAVGGTFHDAFGEMVASEMMTAQILSEYEPGAYDAHINRRSVSKLIGQRRENINRLAKLGYSLNIVYDSTKRANEVSLIQTAEYTEI